MLQVPTTVMAMVDSSVGGKTGVNHPLGKNMIGAFYQPRLVQIDVETLSTLPKRELASGISEIVKYGLIRDPDLFAWLEQNMDKLLARDTAVSLSLCPALPRTHAPALPCTCALHCPTSRLPCEYCLVTLLITSGYCFRGLAMPLSSTTRAYRARHPASCRRACHCRR